MRHSFFFHISVLFAALVSAFLIMSGCCTHRRAVESIITSQTDSTQTEIKVEKAIEYHTDTLYIEIPTQMAERTTQDSTSHLENDYATSDARINLDGSLFHDLKTKPQKKAAEVQIATIRNDSVRVEYKYRNMIVEKEIPIKVERDFTWWEQTCIKWFPWTLILCTLYLGLKFRKPIWHGIKKIFV